MEAGEGEEGRDCLLETQEESPSASAAAGEPSPPPANFSSSSAPLLPLGLTKARPPTGGPGAQRLASGCRLQPRFPSGHRLAWLPPSSHMETDAASLCF